MRQISPMHARHGWPWSSLLVVAVVAGCTLLGGGDNPRPDDPHATAPAHPAGATTWTSLEWQAVTHEQPPRMSDEQWDQATAVTVGPDGWVAVGSNSDVRGYDGRIWRSTDSLAWDLVSADLLTGLELVAVASTPEAFVAVGTRSSDPNDPTTSILRSEDGVTWSEVETIEGAWAARAAAGPHGFAAIVQVEDTNDLMLSPDGLTWDRVPGSDIGVGVWLADIAWDGIGWIAAGSAGDRAVVLRSPDGVTWTEDPLPASGPVDGILYVSAYRVVPGRWATLLLGLDYGPDCAEDEDWCARYQAAWSWTADGGWQRLPESTWILHLGYGVDAFAAGDAGFLSLGSETRTSADGWEWSAVDEPTPAGGFATDAVVSGDRIVAVGISDDTPDDADPLLGWFGSGLIGR